MRSLTGLIVVVTLGSMLASATTAFASADGDANGSTHIVSQARSAADVGIGVESRCLVWRRTTANYDGLTAGYSWAWNVEVGPGSTGDRVREIQCLLDYWGHYDGPLDGRYGSATTDAVAWAQFLCSIYQDGVVGPATWRCLRAGGEV